VEDLARRAVTQTNSVEIITPQGDGGVRLDDPYLVTLADGARSAVALMIATGVAWRKLDMPALKLTGAGVYYGAQAQARHSGEDVYIVGGGELGWTGAVLSKYARKVTMLVRSDSLANMSRT